VPSLVWIPKRGSRLRLPSPIDMHPELIEGNNKGTSRRPLDVI
jgi:hypothetical protein